MRQSLSTNTIQVIKDAVTYELTLAKEGGYVVTVFDYPSCFTQGETIDEALFNAEDALQACLLVDQEQGLTIPQLWNSSFSEWVDRSIPIPVHPKSSK
jgi:predicted RNase H-like HicB family nuclease